MAAIRRARETGASTAIWTRRQPERTFKNNLGVREFHQVDGEDDTFFSVGDQQLPRDPQAVPTHLSGQM